MVYVINVYGQPLMPTERYGKVRRLLKSGKAKVIKRCPFMIQLLYCKDNITQSISLGVDAGSKHMGISATTKDKVLYEADIQLRNDVVDLISSRREIRGSRRDRKTRYRPARFDNRVKNKKEGWLAPSISQKIQTHLTVVDKVCKILPITSITVETANFDIQKIKDPEIFGKEYQKGEQTGFWNVREYVLFRDGHMCQCCKGKSKDKILNVHHIESRKTGGSAPNNLITLCKTCHSDYHKGKIQFPKFIHRGMIFRDAAFMGIMRRTLFNKLKELYPNIEIHTTYGYITKNTRISNGLSKEHFIDARCISGNPLAKSDGIVYYQKKIRCHNRKIHKANPKHGVRHTNQAPYIVKGYRLFDKVLYKRQSYFIFARRNSGYFDIRKLDGVIFNNRSVSYKKIKLLECSRHYLTEMRAVDNSIS